jgi:hypothetical protein
MWKTKRPAVWILLGAIVALPYAAPTAEGVASADSRAGQIARDVLQAMGGEEAWNGTRFVRWRFFGGRLHHWDRYTGDVRIESPARTDREGQEQPSFLVLMNVHSKQGRAWESGEQVTEAEALTGYLDRGHKLWVNDSYWMFMPYKLLDPGVRLTFAGERALEDGRAADVLDLTFEGVGYTPENRYEVFVARDTGLVEQWSFFAEASAEEPDFTLPWGDWKRFGGIMLATNHGQDRDWEIVVYDELPTTVFQSPDPVE